MPDAAFSRDGEWVAYRDSGLGLGRVFVEPFPPTRAKYQIAVGASPVWSPDGKELFLAVGGRLSVLSISTRPSVTFGSPAALSTRVLALSSGLATRTFDISPDGRILGVVAIDSAQTPPAPQIHVVVNWLEELKARVRAR